MNNLKWDNKDERDSLVVELYVNNKFGGHTISKKLGIGKRTVFRILEKKGIKTDSNRKAQKLTDEDIANIIILYSSGLSMPSISEKYSVDPETIRYHINKNHKARSAADTLSVIPVYLQDEIIRLSEEEKLSSYKIAAKFEWPYQSVQAFLKRKGLSPTQGTKEWKEAVQRGIKSGGSSLEVKFREILDECAVEYTTQPALEEFRYDFGLQNDTILVEIQGSYWHTKKQRRQRDSYKQKLARKYGKKLLVLWDYQLENTELVKYKILNSINPPKFDFTSLFISIINWKDAKALLQNWHYQGHGRSGMCLGVKFGSKVIACAVFAKPTRLETAKKQNIEYFQILELTRLIIHPQYQAKNFSSWFISRCIRYIKSNVEHVKLLVSFSDATFGHDGTIYKASNWVLDGTTVESYWYYHRRENKMYHKKSIWNAAKKIGVSEIDYAKSKHLLKVLGLPKSRFIYNL